MLSDIFTVDAAAAAADDDGGDATDTDNFTL